MKNQRLWFAAAFGNSPFRSAPIAHPWTVLGLAMPLLVLLIALFCQSSESSVILATAPFAMKELVEKRNELAAKSAVLAKIFEEAGPEVDMAKVKSIEGDSGSKVEKIRQLNKELDDLGKEVQRLSAVEKALEDQTRREEFLDSSRREDEKRAAQTRADILVPADSKKSIGEQFIESQAFKGYRSGQGIGPIATLDMELKTLFQTTAGWSPESVRTGIITTFPTRPAPHVVDFVPQLPTGQAAVKYMEETTFTNAAAEAAEAGTYAEAALVLTERSETVRKVAVFLPVTDEQLEDEPQARAYVDQRLTFMLQQRLDLQLLVGNGTAPNLKGTENVTGIQTQALGTDPIPDAIFKLMRKIRDDGFAEPGVVFIAPSKWESVRLLRTADGVYIWGNPSEAGPERIWGVQLVQTTAPTATKAVIGDYTNHAALFVRRGIDMQVTNSHSTFFTEGKLAIRADLRVALAHFRPKAFGAVTGL